MKISMICDVDGVMTDGTVWYPSRERLFHVRDGHGFQLLRERTNITPVIMSGEDDMSIVNRAKKLGVDYWLGVPDKHQFIRGVYSLTGGYIAISDDIPDKELLENATIAFCPADAEDEIKAIDGIIVLNKKGGEGCVREAINMILTQPWIHALFKGDLQIK